MCTDLDIKLSPDALLERRQIMRGSSVVTQLLTQWTSMPSKLTTLEEEEHMRGRFPSVAVWGHAAIQQEWNVTAKPKKHSE